MIARPDPHFIAGDGILQIPADKKSDFDEKDRRDWDSSFSALK